jgi:hypothetical protein
VTGRNPAMCRQADPAIARAMATAA